MTLSCGQWLERLVRFVFIGGIVDHYYLNVHFIMHVLISSLYVCILFIVFRYVIYKTERTN